MLEQECVASTLCKDPRPPEINATHGQASITYVSMPLTHKSLMINAFVWYLIV